MELVSGLLNVEVSLSVPECRWVLISVDEGWCQPHAKRSEVRAWASRMMASYLSSCLILGWSSTKIFTTMSCSEGNDVSWHLQKQRPGFLTLERLKSWFHISIKTYDKHWFELTIERNLVLTNLGLHLNGGCEILGVVQNLRDYHIVGFNGWKFEHNLDVWGLFLGRTKSVPDIYKGRRLPSFTSLIPPSYRSPSLPFVTSHSWNAPREGLKGPGQKGSVSRLRPTL